MGSNFLSPSLLKQVAAKYGTPTYVYDAQQIRSRVASLRNELQVPCEIYFAVKACSNIHILSLFRELGCGTDIVSGGELFRSALAKVPSNKIVYSGVGKTENEISQALDIGIASFNAETIQELELINKLAKKKNLIQAVSLRVNPNINVKTHPYISTGLKKNKFGFSNDELKEVCSTYLKFKSLRFDGLSCHIGSQILTLNPLQDAWKAVIELANTMPFKVKTLDIGGGLGISYSEKEKSISLKEYAALINRTFKLTKFKLGIEPGRSLIAPAGVLLTSLTSVKKRKDRTFYVLDSGMNDLIRPALYQATHKCEAVAGISKKTKVDIVGPVCETGDTFEVDAELPVSQTGDLFIFKNAGAYGMSMASHYNSRTKPAEVLVDGTKIKLIRKRENYGDLVQNEIF